jgi:Cu-processing system permease protein
MLKVIKYVMVDILRSKIALAYTIFLLAISLSIFNLEDNSSKGLLSMLNIILIIIPLVSLIFSTIYMYNSAEFIELLLSQPIQRKKLLLSIYSGICLSLIIAFAIGAGIPMILLEGSVTSYVMTLTGFVLTAIFVSLSVLGAVITRDKAKGIGIAIMMWLYFSLLYDGLILLIMFQFSDYPLEKAMIAFSSLNPVDMARILILLKLDISAMMGYTGAIFNEFLGTRGGIIFSTFVMVLWILIPLLISLKRFKTKDL